MQSDPEIFISWSGDISQVVAEELRSWLPLVLNGPSLWLSSKDLPEGSRWNAELSQRLAASSFGIIVATPENLSAPWILFEAGALSKSHDLGHVIPYVVGSDIAELPAPLRQFQAIKADRDGTKRLVKSINRVITSPAEDAVVEQRFDRFWPQLEDCLRKCSRHLADVDQCIVSPTDDSSLESQNPAITRLQRELSATNTLIRQLAASLVAEGSQGEVGTDQRESLPESALASLEGAWRNSRTASHMYARVVGGKLIAPYCYRGNNELTAVYYDWKLLGEYWFARFQWLEHSDVRGFAFYRLTGQHELSGKWWIDENAESIPAVMESMPPHSEKGDAGAENIWVRLLNHTVPVWAEEYFGEFADRDSDDVGYR